MAVELSERQKRILKLILNHSNIKEIKESERISFKTIYKHINKLKEQGLLRKIGKVYEVTGGGLKSLVVYDTADKKLIRANDIRIKVKILYSPDDWSQRRINVLRTRNYNYKPIKLKNNIQYDFSIRDIKIKTTTKHIIIYMPDFYGYDMDEIGKDIIDLLYKTLYKLENIFNILLVKDNYCNIEITEQHYSLLQTYLAKHYHQEKEKFYVTDENGELRIIVDFSHFLEELELVHPTKSPDDTPIEQRFHYELLKTGLTPIMILEMFDKQLKLNEGNKETMIMLDKNFRTHMGVLKNIGIAINELRLEISKINRKNIRTDYSEQKDLGWFK